MLCVPSASIEMPPLPVIPLSSPVPLEGTIVNDSLSQDAPSVMAVVEN